MKLLALSDMHSSEEALDRLKVRASRTSYDAVILCGDLTNRGPLSYAEEILGVFPKTYAVHGNMDSPEVAKAIARSGAQLHGKKVKFGEWNLVGLGGSNPTPFNTPNELSEEEIERTLREAGVDDFSILVSHPPPFGVFDLVGQMHVGSKAVRKLLEEKRPIMVICGHIHEHEGREVVRDTLVVKLAPAEKMRAAEIDISDKIDVRFINI